MNTLISRVATLKASVVHKRKVKRNLKKQCAEIADEMYNLNIDLSTHEDAVILIEYLIDKKYDNVVHLFEKTITSALHELWDDQYQFTLDIGRRGDNIAVEFKLMTGEYEVPKLIQMTQGASVKQIVGTVMRIVLVKLDKKLPNFLILDESLSGLSTTMQYKAGNFFNKLGKDFEMQLIWITQSESFAKCADTIIDVTKRD